MCVHSRELTHLGEECWFIGIMSCLLGFISCSPDMHFYPISLSCDCSGFNYDVYFGQVLIIVLVLDMF